MANFVESKKLPLIGLIGVDRPDLSYLLRKRGFDTSNAPDDCTAALVAESAPRPSCRAVIQTRSVEAAIEFIDAGASDVVLATDPDNYVAARLAALVRHHRASIVTVGALTVDSGAREARVGARRLELQPREFQLLAYLAHHAGTTLDRDSIYRAIYGGQPTSNMLAVHVSRLRAELGGAVELLSIRGQGYVLQVKHHRSSARWAESPT